MKTIIKPDIQQEEICDSLKELNYRDRVIKKSNEYENILSNPQNLLDDEQLFEIYNYGYTDHMVKMYTQRFSNSSYKDVHSFYLKIRNAVKTCPYCGIVTRQVKQLDHYFSKKKYPSLSLIAKNLVPVCMDCNNIKLEEEGKNFIHPYYDVLLGDSIDFLKCKLIEEINIGFKFEIKRMPLWDDDLYKRVCTHFDKLRLYEAYTSDFSADFNILKSELEILYNPKESNFDYIKNHINLRAQAQFNSKIKPWIYAGYKCLLESDWFFTTYLPTVLISKFSK